jgi:hypothetical protein
MESLEFVCQNIGILKVIGNRLHDGHDFVVKSNAKTHAVDYLIFLDSRGISCKFEGSLADKLISQITLSGFSYLLVCRPIELTTWATLINFMVINTLNPGKIISNMGFVDFTPKKLAILEDAIEQVEFTIGKGVATSMFVEAYISSSGEGIDLYSMSYSEEYKKAIECITNKIPTVIINTPIVAEDIDIERKRPHSFYVGLAIAKEFNQTIKTAQLVDIPDFDELLTYDAVHSTQQGNEVIFEKIKDYL